MVTFFNIIRILIVAVAVPFFMGNLAFSLPGRERKGVKVTETVAFGFLFMCVLFLVMAVPMIFMRAAFHLLVYLWTSVTALLCVLSVFLFIRKRGYRQIGEASRSFLNGLSADHFTPAVWISAALIILFEACLITFNMHIDTDDARFIAEAMEAVEKDTMLLHHAITGKYVGFVPGEQIKDVTSPYPLFIALLSELYGIHPAITAHTVLPPLLIFLSYIVFDMIGDFLSGSDIKKRGLFLLFLSIINLFSFETIYASGYTLLTIIWQGRSVCAMIMLPLLWYVLMIVSEKESIGAPEYFAVVISSLGNTMMSSMGSIFAPILIVVYAFVNLVKKKGIKSFVFTCLCALPSLACIIVTRIMRLLF